MTPDPPVPVTPTVAHVDTTSAVFASTGAGNYYQKLIMSDGTTLDISGNYPSSTEISGTTARYYAVLEQADGKFRLVCCGGSDYAGAAFKYWYVSSTTYWTTAQGTQQISPYTGIGGNFTTDILTLEMLGDKEWKN